MKCKECNAEMVIRKGKNADDDAPVIYICPVCGRTVLCQGEDIEHIES